MPKQTSQKQEFRNRIDQVSRLVADDRKIEAQTVFFQLLEQPLEAIEDIKDVLSLAEIATKLGEKVDAINLYAEAVKRFPENATYLVDLAQAFIDNDMLSDAEKLLHQAISLNPESYKAYIKLSYIYIIRDQNYPAAISVLEKARELKPSEPHIYYNLTGALTHCGRSEEAYQYAKKLLRLQPEQAVTYHIMGRVLVELGRFDEAETYFKKAISKDRALGHSYTDLASIKKYSSKDSDFIRQAEKALQLGMSSKSRSAIHFCLGKIYNDCKEWDKAFEHYRQGNLLKKAAVRNTDPYVIYKHSHKVFSRSFLQKHRNLGSDSQVPVFVVGMPRSGTTLIERIVASHPQGAGAGELKRLAEVNYAIYKEREIKDYRQCLDSRLDKQQLGELADMYLEVLREGREEATRIVDKMPNNFIFLGLINLLFPQAKIIHAIRSPLDIALSCYFQPFESIDWANDFESIAEEYRFYRKAMAHWKKILPEGTIIDVSYENLTASPETEVRRLIEGIGLPWDPTCLEFHKKKGVVITASVWQVRQPLYKTSRKKWVSYARHLEGLANELREYLDDEDVQELAKHGVKLKRKWRLNPFA